MKKLNLLLIICFITLNAMAQKSQSNGSISVYYGTKSKLGFDFIFGKKISWGLGVSTYLGKGAVGKNYSETIGPNAFPSDIYEVIEADNIGIYGILGSRVTNHLIIAGRLGAATRTKYYNGYDNNQILSPNGYWYTSTDAGTKVLVGAFTQYEIKKWSASFGADNFNGVTIGVGLNF
jgi:hypothetical protein